MTRLRDAFPPVRAARGGIRFPRPGSVEWERAQADRRAAEAVEAMVTRSVGTIVEHQHRTMDEAVAYASERGYDVHVYRHWQSRYLGIEFRPQAYSSPVIHEHRSDDDAYFD